MSRLISENTWYHLLQNVLFSRILSHSLYFYLFYVNVKLVCYSKGRTVIEYVREKDAEENIRT
jgi:hypothetical protein